MKRVLAVALMTIGMQAMAAPPKVAPAKDSPASKRMDDAKIRVLDMLKDPDSAKFKQLHLAADEETVCGAVNSKNSMGGYVGFQNFMVEPDGRIFFDDTGPSFPGMIAAKCEGSAKQERDSS